VTILGNPFQVHKENSAPEANLKSYVEAQKDLEKQIASLRKLLDLCRILAIVDLSSGGRFPDYRKLLIGVMYYIHKSLENIEQANTDGTSHPAQK
jgi:hypothetical protein